MIKITDCSNRKGFAARCALTGKKHTQKSSVHKEDESSVVCCAAQNKRAAKKIRQGYFS